MRIRDFQRVIERTYLERDRARGLEATFMWFVEEVGELARDLQQHRAAGGGDGPVAPDSPLAREFADVLAWLSTLASIVGCDLEAAATAKYGGGCPRCGAVPCACSHRASPPPVETS
ncbi:MAG: nucleotide pyrophosphohydrolase [Planctomycetota bacterium]|nr:MAG: nucleotide pyrophosphohydrolase [Planctomycetota bacterium]